MGLPPRTRASSRSALGALAGAGVVPEQSDRWCFQTLLRVVWVASWPWAERPAASWLGGLLGGLLEALLGEGLGEGLGEAAILGVFLARAIPGEAKKLILAETFIKN